MEIQGQWAIVLHSGSEDSRLQPFNVLVRAHGQKLVTRLPVTFGSICPRGSRVDEKTHK